MTVRTTALSRAKAKIRGEGWTITGSDQRGFLVTGKGWRKSMTRAELLAFAAITDDIIVIGDKTYQRFVRFPHAVTDGTYRCIACGQIDEPEYHDWGLCKEARAELAA